MSYFCIVSVEDSPIFECSVGNSDQKDDLNQFIVHAALDHVEWHLQNKKQACLLGAVDKFNDNIVSCFVTPSNIKFLLLHPKNLDENVNFSFFFLPEILAVETFSFRLKKETGVTHDPYFSFVFSYFSTRILFGSNSGQF